MSIRLVALTALTLMASGCVVEQPAPPHRHPVVVEEPAPGPGYVEVIAPQPPPAVVIEEEPAPRPGYIWARGYWHWNGHKYVAMHGHWEAARPGYHYVHPHYVQHGDGWHLSIGAGVAG